MTASGTPAALEFAAARHATDRAALARFIAGRAGAGGEVALATARAEFLATAPLLAPGVGSAARSALTVVRGPPVVDVSWTAWPHVKRTWSGSHFTRSWNEFGCWHVQLAAQVVEKGESIAYAAVTNTDGRRRNASTAAVHMLLLDADGTGDWFTLWNEIVALDLAALLHRTASHTPAVPKWRVAFPLASPISTSTPRSVLAWRGMYATARTVFGSLARLQGPGFDPATDGPHHPWFPGSRRGPETPAPEVVQRAGATLDLNRLVASLPVAAPRVTHVASTTRWGTPSLLALAFEAAGLLGPALGQGRTAVVCPWNFHHTAPLAVDAAPTSATVLFEGNSGANVGAFHCMHASCGSKSAREVLAELPADAVEYARAVHRADTHVAGRGPTGWVAWICLCLGCRESRGDAEAYAEWVKESLERNGPFTLPEEEREDAPALATLETCRAALHFRSCSPLPRPMCSFTTPRYPRGPWSESRGHLTRGRRDARDAGLADDRPSPPRRRRPHPLLLDLTGGRAGTR